jgi:hypothetical protein
VRTRSAGGIAAVLGALLLAATTLTSPVERSLHVPPAGTVTKPPADFRGMSQVDYAFLSSDGHVLRFENRSVGSGDGHTTLTTGRDLPNGSLACAAFDWLYRAGEFEQTARNLVWQEQMVGSPIAAISTEQKTDRWSLVDRVNGSEHRHDLGPIPWGRWAYFVVCVKLGSQGYVEAWAAIDAWPDVSTAPRYRVTGNTWQGTTAHQTLGMYARHSRMGVYVGFAGHYARAATPQRAIELAVAA